MTAERIKEINPAVTLTPVMKAFLKENGSELLRGVNVVDALDNIPIRLELGILSFTDGFVASIEAAEVCKIHLNEGVSLKQRMFIINLLDMEIVEVQL